MEVVKCPSCNGRGTTTRSTDAGSDYEDQCYSCKGKGVVIQYINPITNKVEYRSL